MLATSYQAILSRAMCLPLALMFACAGRAADGPGAAPPAAGATQAAATGQVEGQVEDQAKDQAQDQAKDQAKDQASPSGPQVSAPAYVDPEAETRGREEPWTTTARAAATSEQGIVWQPFSEELMAAARATGRPVFLQYSAEWCKPCVVHEREYFSKPEIRQAFAASGVLPIKADMTTPNEVMETWILALTRMSLPTYAVYYADGAVDLLPMQLTRSSLVDALARVPAH